MIKDKWIEKLKRGLQGLSKDEIDDIVADYNEYFYNAKEKGRTEEEVCESLGDPNKLAKQLKADCRIKTAQENMSPKNILKAIFAILTLSVFNLVIMIGPIMGIVGIIFGAGVAGVALLGAGIISFFGLLIFGSSALAGLGFGLTLGIALLLGLFLSSMGIILIILDFWFGKWVFNGLVKYFKFNYEIVRKTAD